MEKRQSRLTLWPNSICTGILLAVKTLGGWKRGEVIRTNDCYLKVVLKEGTHAVPEAPGCLPTFGAVCRSELTVACHIMQPGSN